jgi:acetyltransferase-like isoleucine patch superfamily enzyme/dTDP-4-dehydrorhamnose 3,5-epimerase-like enzyme
MKAASHRTEKKGSKGDSCKKHAEYTTDFGPPVAAPSDPIARSAGSSQLTYGSISPKARALGRDPDMSKTSYFRHESAIVEGETIGENTNIGAFAHVLRGARIGRDGNICDHVFIENDVIVGDRVTIKPGVQLWDGVTIEDDVFIGPNATFTNDGFPRSKYHSGKLGRIVVKKGASIGANATILPGLTIGQNAMVGAGAVISADVPPNTVLAGNPAQIIGYVGTSEAESVLETPREIGSHETSVAGVRLYRMPLVEDLRGWLSFGEVQGHLPFEIRRYFLVFGVTGEHIRGEHAHKRQHQFLICVHGRVHIVADDGHNREEFVLDSPDLGIHICPMVWAAQYRYSKDAVLLVLSSDKYDVDDYIRDHTEFLALVGA